MSAVQKVKGHPVLGGPNDRLLAPIVPSIRPIVKAEVLREINLWDIPVLASVRLPLGLRLPANIRVDFGDLQHTGWWSLDGIGSRGAAVFARQLADAAAETATGEYGVKFDDLDADGQRDAWALIQRSAIQIEGESWDVVVEAVADLEQALADLAAECGLAGDRDE